jgi:phytoene dehydrogenase-like protein
MKRESVETLVIGAGLAGLAAAVRLHEAGREVLVLEASDAVGGRVRTEEIDGFLLDRGFQVYLDAYPESGRFLDLPALDLHPFEPGALVWKGGRLRRIMDVFRRPGHLLETALQPVGTPLDKLRVARMRRRLLRNSPEAIWSDPPRATIDLLREEGFSGGFVDEFFRGFYGGIFLEDLLATSSRMFEFTFSLFSRGSATLPGKGMQSIPRQVAARLPAGSIRFHSPARAIDGTTVRTDDSEFTARRIILATDGTTATGLVPERHSPRWNGTACLQFAAPEAPFPDRLIALRGDRGGIIHHLCAPSNVAPGYAPAGSALVSVSVIGRESVSPDLEARVRRELQEWFGSRTDRWELLSLHRIERSLPVDPPGHFAPLPRSGGVFLCGDHTRSASIEGALGSGLDAAGAVLADTW